MSILFVVDGAGNGNRNGRVSDLANGSQVDKVDNGANGVI